jgi:hypothetical protein
MFTRPDRKNVQLSSHSVKSQGGNMLRSHRGSLPHILPSYSAANSCPQNDLPASHSSTGSAETLFWNPIPTALGVPILPRNSYPVGPMDLDNMLGDGFKMSETWNHDQANAYGGSGEAGYPQVSGDGDAYANAEVAQFTGAGHTTGHVSEVTQGAVQSFDASWWGGEGSLER